MRCIDCVHLDAHGTGGNASAQISITVIRGLSLGEIRMRDVFWIFWKE